VNNQIVRTLCFGAGYRRRLLIPEFNCYAVSLMTPTKVSSRNKLADLPVTAQDSFSATDGNLYRGIRYLAQR
jgi:hypothetical protein